MLLADLGIETLEEAARYSDKELLRVRSIGKVFIKKLRRIVASERIPTSAKQVTGGGLVDSPDKKPVPKADLQFERFFRLSDQERDQVVEYMDFLLWKRKGQR
jgi:hypothetical protein